HHGQRSGGRGCDVLSSDAARSGAHRLSRPWQPQETRPTRRRPDSATRRDDRGTRAAVRHGAAFPSAVVGATGLKEKPSPRLVLILAGEIVTLLQQCPWWATGGAL